MRANNPQFLTTGPADVRGKLSAPRGPCLTQSPVLIAPLCLPHRVPGPPFSPCLLGHELSPPRRQEKHSSGPSRTKEPSPGRCVPGTQGAERDPLAPAPHGAPRCPAACCSGGALRARALFPCCTAAGPDSRTGRPRSRNDLTLLRARGWERVALHGHGEEEAVGALWGPLPA